MLVIECLIQPVHICIRMYVLVAGTGKLQDCWQQSGCDWLGKLMFHSLT